MKFSLQGRKPDTCPFKISGSTAPWAELWMNHPLESMTLMTFKFTLPQPTAETWPCKDPNDCFAIKQHKVLHHLMGVGGEVSQLYTGKDREGIFLWFGDSCHVLLSTHLLASSGTVPREQERLYLSMINITSSITTSISLALFTALAILKFFQCQFYRHID